MFLSLQLNLSGKCNQNVSENVWNPRVSLGLNRISSSSIRSPSYWTRRMNSQYLHFQVKDTNRHNDFLMEKSVPLLWWCKQNREQFLHQWGLWPLLSYATVHVPLVLREGSVVKKKKKKVFHFHYCGFIIWRYKNIFYNFFLKSPKIALVTLDLSHTNEARSCILPGWVRTDHPEKLISWGASLLGKVNGFSP